RSSRAPTGSRPSTAPGGTRSGSSWTRACCWSPTTKHPATTSGSLGSTARRSWRRRGGMRGPMCSLVFNSSAVSIHAMWVEINAPPDNGEERVNEWDPGLEALPSGRDRPELVVNPRDFASDPWRPDEPEDEEERPDPAAWQPPLPPAPAPGRPQAATTRASAYTRLRLDGYGSGASSAPRLAAPAGPPPPREARGPAGAERARLLVPSLPPRPPPG
ncbi:unnamed protein product, partial [Prorocentrum cordatum]